MLRSYFLDGHLELVHRARMEWHKRASQTSSKPEPKAEELSSVGLPKAQEAARTQRQDVYQLVTERITAALEAGTIPWKKPWAEEGGMPRNLITQHPYRGMNVFLLACGPLYSSPFWLTFRQAEELGGHVRKGERGSLITFWKFPQAEPHKESEGEDETEEREGRPAPLLRYYHVFNLEQCEGIDAPPSEEFQPKPHERILLTEQIIAGMPRRPALLSDPRQAFYSPTADEVRIPNLDHFETAESYYGTLFHELTHSTGHSSRLARPALGIPSPYGTPDYSKEELVAEFGAAFLCGHAGISPVVVDNQAAYINGWLARLKQEKRLLPIAAAQAQRAADFILGAHGDDGPNPNG